MNFKSIFLCGAIALFLLAATGCGSNDEIHRTGIGQAELPNPARTFIRTHFTDSQMHKIKECQKITQGKDEWYEVLLANSDLLTFDKDGQWTILDSFGMIPESAIPEGIRNYVNDNYRLAFVQKITRLDSGFEVVLNNKETLRFDTAGNKI